jgi:hypothetical protein
MKIINTSEQARQELVSDLFGINKPENIQEVLNKYDDKVDIAFKKKIIYIVLGIFVVSVGVLWSGLGWVAYSDHVFIEKELITPSERIITEKVLFALIAATVTQVSISFGLMMKYLFSENDAQIKSPTKIEDATSKTP